jgi:hypothetical protein
MCNFQESEFHDKRNGVFTEFKQINSDRYRIYWGNKKVKIKSKKIYEVFGTARTYEVKEYNTHGIILRRSTGQSNWDNLVLPLDFHSKEMQYRYGLAWDLKNHIIVYSANEGKPFLTIENFKTRKKQYYFENDICYSLQPFLCIDSCKIKNKYFYIWYQGSQVNKTNKDNPIYKRLYKKIEIKV